MSVADKIVKVVELNAPIERVWSALTDHKEFGTWFKVDLDQPFEPGAKSTGQITYPGYEHVPWLAFVERMDEPHLFSFRWYDSEEVSAEPNDNPPLRVEFRLDETAGGTRLTITESGFSAFDEPRRSELMDGNKEGWNIQAVNIAEYLYKNGRDD